MAKKVQNIYPRVYTLNPTDDVLVNTRSVKKGTTRKVISYKNLIGEIEKTSGSANYNSVDSYRSSLESDGYVYSGYLLNSVPVIVRCLDSVETTARDVEELELSWAIKDTLTYI